MYSKMPKTTILGQNLKFNRITPKLVTKHNVYEWITFFRTTVSIPPLLGQPCQILMYGPPRADDRLQLVTDNDDGSGYVFKVAL